MGEVFLVRHGETDWSANGRHTSRTELDLTPAGERQAADLAERLAGHPFVAVLTSPRRRAVRTAELAGLVPTESTEDLAEWNYGEYEGRTTAAIRTDRPGWELWTDGAPGGEKPAEVGARLDRVLARAAAYLPDGDVALVAHGHSLRVAGVRWIGLPPAAGALLRLDTGTVSVLGHEHGRRVIHRWNQ
jgi:broad specificity phosphatase PhoE